MTLLCLKNKFESNVWIGTKLVHEFLHCRHRFFASHNPDNLYVNPGTLLEQEVQKKWLKSLGDYQCQQPNEKFPLVPFLLQADFCFWRHSGNSVE